MAKGGSYGGRGGSKLVTMYESAEDDSSEPGEGSCCIAWDCEGKHLVSSNSHSHLLFHAWPPVSTIDSVQEPLRKISQHRSAITAIALSPSGRSLASGSLDHSVKLFSYPDGEFQSNVTRFTLPIRSVAFSPTGSLLAAAGEDDGIKLISTIDSSIVRVFKGHNAPIVSLTFDPNNEYLASAGSDGTVMCWSLSSGKRVHTLYHAAPNVGVNNSSKNEVAWHPKGDVLAVPGRKNGVDVVMYDRDTGEKVFSLKGGHSATVGFLAWSPNGKYLATAAGDNQVIIWDVDNRQDVDCQKFETQICSLAWKPKGNALALIDADGKFGVWDPVVPSHMTLPSDDTPVASVIDREELLHFSDDEENEEALSEDESRPFSPEHDHSASLDLGAKKNKHKAAEHESYKRSSFIKKAEIKHSVVPSTPQVVMSHLQKAFQSCSTQSDMGKRHFLTYNDIGSITSCLNEGLCHVEVEFHDTGRGVRVPAMTDYFGFTMAAMNEKGSIFASARKGEKNPSTVLYRPFSSWASNSEWSVRLQSDEEAKCVAIGSSWVAVATNHNNLRLFSEGGLQIFVLSFEGPVVTMVGHANFLALVTHSGTPFPCGQQVLRFTLLNVVDHTKVLEGPLPLSPGSELSWLGFSDNGFLSSYDSKGILRVHSKQYGGCWLPVFSASKAVKGENESIWMVGLTTTQVMCVVCKLPEKQPLVSPKPVLSLFNLAVPLVNSDFGADELESEFLLGNWQLSQLTEEAGTVGDEYDKEDDILKMEANLDKCILRMIAAACKGDKHIKVVELTKKLTLDKSWKGAIKLVTAMRLPALAERLSALYEEKMARETCEGQAGNGVVHTQQTSYDIKTAVAQNPLKTTATKSVLSAGPSDPVINKRIIEAPVVQKTANARSDNKETIYSTSLKDPSTSDVGEKSAGATSCQDSPASRPCNPFTKSSSNPFAKSSSNPFAKSSTGTDSQSGGSLLDSLKRMRDTDESKGKGNKSAKFI